MATPEQNVRWIHITCWMIGGLIFSALLGQIFDTIENPRNILWRAAEIMVATGDKPGEESPLSSSHAAITLRNFYLHPHPGGIRIQPEKLRPSVRIRAEEAGTRITVDVPDMDGNRELAQEIARIFRGIPRERELSAAPVEIHSFSKADRERAIDAQKIKELLQDQAARAGYVDFLQILPKAVNGSAKAKSIAEDQDFSRRFRRYEELSVNMGLEGIPGTPLTSAPEIVFDARIVGDPNDGKKPTSHSNLVSVVCMGFAAIGAWLTTRRTSANQAADIPEISTASR